MGIKTGIGVGAAQIADTSGIMNAYARQQAQAQREQAAQAQREYLSAEKEKERSERAAAKFDEDLADIMASVKIGGIRDIDVPEITKAYNEVKDFYSKSGSLKDSEKPLFRAELRNRMNTINDSAINSKEVEKRRYAIALKVSENPWDYDPKVVQDLDFINKTPLSKLGSLANMDPIGYQKLPNVKLLDNIMKDVSNQAEKNAQYSKEEKIGSDKYRDVTIADKVYVQKNLIQGVMSSPEAYSSVKRIFASENPGQQPTDQALTEFLTKKYEEKYPYIYKSDIKKQPREPKTEAEKTETVYADYVNRAVGGDTKAWRQLEALGGGNYVLAPSPKGDKYLRIIPNKIQKIPVEGGIVIENKITDDPIDINRDATELFKYLQKYNIRPSGSKTISKLKESSTSTPNKTKTVTGKVDNKL